MNLNIQNDKTNRRDFLRRLLCATLSAVGAGALGGAFWDRTGPRPAPSGNTAAPIPDFSIAGQTGKLSIARDADRGRSLKEALGALGGIHQFVKPGERVLLKVNAAFASPPMLGATTHPEMVGHIGRLCYEAGAAQVLITDNPINDPAGCFALTGIDDAARSVGAQVILPMQDRFESYTLAGGRLIRHWPVLCAPLRRVDKVIGIAPVKDHHRSGASMTLKNWYGLLGGRRNIFHQQIHSIIAELALLIKPTLVILDGTQSMIQNGPTGGSLDDLKATHTMIVGTDPVAVDTAGAKLLDKTVEDLPHLLMAQKAGAGTTNYRSILID